MCTIEPSRSRLRKASLRAPSLVASPRRTSAFTSGPATTRANAAPRVFASRSAARSATLLAMNSVPTPIASKATRLPMTKRVIACRTADFGSFKAGSPPRRLVHSFGTDQPVAHRDHQGVETRVRPDFRQQRLDGSSGRFLRHPHLTCNGTHVKAGDEHPQNLLFLLRKWVVARRGSHLLGNEAGVQAGVDVELGGCLVADYLQHLPELPVLREQRARMGSHDAADQGSVGERGENHDTHVGKPVLELRRRRDAVAVTEPYVHHDNVGSQRTSEVDRGDHTIGGAHAVDVALRRKGERQRLREDAVVVDNEDARSAAGAQSERSRTVRATSDSSASCAGALTPGVMSRVWRSRRRSIRSSTPSTAELSLRADGLSRRMARYSSRLSAPGSSPNSSTIAARSSE